MKNLTLKIDERVLQQARHYALSHGTSVNALVRAYLEQLATTADRAAAARKTMAELASSHPARVGAATWTRDELHGR